MIDLRNSPGTSIVVLVLQSQWFAVHVYIIKRDHYVFSFAKWETPTAIYVSQFLHYAVVQKQMEVSPMLLRPKYRLSLGKVIITRERGFQNKNVYMHA